MVVVLETGVYSDGCGDLEPFINFFFYPTSFLHKYTACSDCYCCFAYENSVQIIQRAKIKLDYVTNGSCSVTAYLARALCSWRETCCGTS